MPSSSDEIKPLKRKLATIKTRLTKFVNFISAPQNSTKIIEIKKRLQLIEPCLEQYEDVHTQILLIDENETNENELSEFESKFFKAISDAESLIINSVGASPLQGSTRLLTTNQNAPIKLPEIHLNTFSGSFTEWITFRDSFKALIHNNDNLNAIQKFHYLKSSLTGEAKQTIDHLTPSIDNYAAAWDLLEKRYENKRLITQHHVRALFTLPQINSKDSKGLRSLLHTLTSNIKALESINRPIGQWDDLLVYLVSSKFDNNTTVAWEATLTEKLPTYDDIIKFITQRCHMLESIESNNMMNKIHFQTKFTANQSHNSNPRASSHIAINSDKTQPKCPICNQQHNIYNCAEFLKLNIEQRIQEIKKQKLCTNCLRASHKFNACTASSCKKCNKRHNSLLHLETNPSTTVNNAEPQPSCSFSFIANTSSHVVSFTKNVILSTAIISVSTKDGRRLKLRALLDNGSASNFITKAAVRKLQLSKIQKINFSITGIACSMTKIDSAVTIQIHSNETSFNCKLNCLIVPEITENIPLTSFKPLSNIPNNVKLADPTYFQSNSIDILIGNEIFWSLISIGQISLEKHGPILQKTQLGWIVSGPISVHQTQPAIQCNISNAQINRDLQNFLNIEEFQDNKALNIDDPCERHFLETFARDPSGRFKVKLPFINEPPLLGKSYDRVLQMFYNLERRLQRDSNLYDQYKEFMQTYLDLNHMSKISQPNFSGYFLTHHAVINQSSETTKLRVVFNGSFKTSNNMSLNDNLYVGQNLQQDLFSILVRFRIHKFVITADIKKMYRQILVHEDHRKYQQILWRNDINEPIKFYQLNTVTYGLSPCSFLAARCLQELAYSEADNYPDTYHIIIRDSYVDDIISGSDSEFETQKLLNELTEILNKGGFELHKINSNSPSITSTHPNFKTSNEISLDKQTTSKTLGVLWDREVDSIKYATHLNESKSLKITKRGILSVIAHIFDPLGLVAPVTITAKIILQKIWAIKLNWDESLPTELHTKWSEFLNHFRYLDNISIPRHVILSKQRVEMHGFCDSSLNAYGACIYLRTQNPDETYNTRLLCAKSKVAPLKSLSIPRLELCGALLLAKLVEKTKQALNIALDECYYWSDSTIILAWIRTSPSKLKPFVSHRVSQIQKLTSPNKWQHISTNDNPADILSRGVTPSQLSNSRLWWQGPEFLDINDSDFINYNDKNVEVNSEIPELKSLCCLSLPKPKIDILTKFSSFNKLIRIVALCLRFTHNLKNKTKIRGTLTCHELERAHNIVIKLVQQESFQDDIHNLKEHNHVAHNSKIKTLNPYLDNSGLLRVGGRLENSTLSTDQKHQLLLPKHHHVTNLIIKKYHIENLHSGCQATLTAIRQKYWPISAKNNVRKIIFNCIKCYKTKPIPYGQLMANLPKDRITPSRPFTITGVDYAGPITLKNGHGRTSKTIKAYIAIFVCFSTRAVHIELVCECTSSAFLNALKRFMSRRGKPNKICSDNGTNFVGANHQLKELWSLIKTKEFENVVINNLTNQQIEWSFIPPRAPHMGGLWEASVKTLKSHMKRVLGNTLLNYEEMYTILTMIEACMNSRPITPLSNDPNDRSALTPGHFLIGNPLTAPAEPNLLDTSCNRLSRYQLLEQLRQHFWKRWSHEYLHQLQQRYKWNSSPDKQPKPGDLVIVKEDNFPPLHWPLGRITATHPGSDGQCRVVSVQTVRGVSKRPVSKICAVPVND